MLKKPDRIIEGLLLPVIALTALLLSLADLFGFLPIIPASHIPMLTLSIVSLILSSLMFIQRRSTQIHEQTERLFAKMILEQMADEMLGQIEPGLRKVFDDYFLDRVESLQIAIKESKVQVNGNARMNYYFIRTLQRYPRASFLSMQCLATHKMWEDQSIEAAIASFIQSGGKIECILFVKDDQELALPEVQKMIERQRKIGMRVHIINSSGTLADLKKNFIVESKGRIAWEIHKNSEYFGATVTTNKSLANSYCRIFKKLRESEIHT